MRYGSDSIERGIYCLIDARDITQKIPDRLTTPSLESEIREHVQGCMLPFCDSRDFRGDSHAFHRCVVTDQTQVIVPMSREEAYALTSIVGDCRVSQVVDIRKGVHCMIPKSVFVHGRPVRQ
jgi:hypothetical protein